MIDKHWIGIGEFIVLERWSGGPDPHVDLVAKMSEKCNWIEKVWRGLCYIGPYCVPTAYWIWNEFPWKRACKNLSNVEDWLEANWKGIIRRKERKCVITPDKMAKYLISARDWLLRLEKEQLDGYHSWLDRSDIPPKEKYELAWDDVQKIYGMGRYVAIKFLEFGNRHLGFETVIPDIRPDGGWSPRISLALLWPQHKDLLENGKSKKEIDQINSIVNKTRAILQDELGVDVSYFELQVALCEYKQSFIKKKQYPGRTHDTEMKYEIECAKHFGTCDEMYEARKKIFPNVCLGELHGWTDVRKDLGFCLADYGFTWSDGLYLYNSNVNNPIRRKPSLVKLPRALRDARKALKATTPLPNQNNSSGRVSKELRTPKKLGVKVIISGKLLQGKEFFKYPLEWKKQQLKELGIDVIYNVSKKGDPDSERLGVEYFHAHFPDGKEINKKHVFLAAKTIGDLIEKGKKVLIHCFAGKNRSSFINALVLVRLHKLSGQSALDLIRKIRPNAIDNPMMEKFIKRAFWNGEKYIIKKGI